MVHITTNKEKAKHERTPRDVYFDALEEAYGNLPVPSDDYADIQTVLVKYYMGADEMPESEAIEKAAEDIEKLEGAIEVIADHYSKVAIMLKKVPKFG